RPPPPFEVLARARDQVGDVDQAAVRRRRRQHLAGVLVLEVVDPRQREGGALQLVVVERVGDPDAVQPQLAGVAAQAVEELAAGAGGDACGLPGGLAHLVSPAATALSASSSGIAVATCSVCADTCGCSPGPARSTSQSTTRFSSRPRPDTSTATVSPGSIGRELAGVPLRTTSPGSRVIRRFRSASR